MRFALTLTLLLAPGIAAAQRVSGHEPAHANSSNSAATAATAATAYGSPGNAADVTRIIEVSLRDSMRIEPDQLRVTQGETLRLRIRNAGAIAHEFVLGTPKEILEHRDMMRTMPTMKNDDANAVSVAPGARADLIWRFSVPGTFVYACLIPGHWEAGMQGTVTVDAAAKPGRVTP